MEDDEQRQKILNELFHCDTNVSGKGVSNLYKYVTTKYINITQRHIKSLVSTNNDYQITETSTKRTNKPIISKYTASNRLSILLTSGLRGVASDPSSSHARINPNPNSPIG